MDKIKICGITCLDDVTIINTAKPDFAGFILTDGFRRSINAATAKSLKMQINKKIKTVGVFVNDDPKFINSCYDKLIIDLVQLHGKESPNYCRKIKAPVIKAFICKDDIEQQIAQYEDCCDYFLFDSGQGSGKQINTSLVPNCNKPYFLAGGISEKNIDNIKSKLSPYCFDVSSSVETNGKKDFDKIINLVGRIHYE